MLAKCCVFSKQSYLTFMCQPSNNYFTFQFNNNSIATLSFEITELFCLVPSGEFSQHLSIFYLPTSVGLEYGILYIIFSCINKKNKSILLIYYLLNIFIINSSSIKAFAYILRDRLTHSNLIFLWNP